MSHFVARTRHAADRVAACALYRALLTQASRLTSFSAEERSELHDLIRNRTRRNRHFQNVSKIRLLFTAGYEAIDVLDAAVAGDVEKQTYIRTLLSKAPARLKRKKDDAEEVSKEKARTPSKGSSELSSFTQKDHPSIFSRPLPLSSLTGQRHIPVLFNASGIPVLRIKKPQPKALTSFIVSRIKQRQARLDRLKRLRCERDLGELEDVWDEVLGREKKGGGGNRDGGVSWKSEPGVAIGVVLRQLGEEREKNRVMARRMQGVVDREREVWEEEREEREERERERGDGANAAAAAAAAEVGSRG